MEHEIQLMRIGRINLTTLPSALGGSLLLWAAFSSVGFWLLHLPLGLAIFGGFCAMVIHWASEILHQLGHAWAAWLIRYPMSGIRMWGVLSTSLYPVDEPALPPAMHIRRALGGPSMSLTLSVITGILALWLRPAGGLPWWLALFACADNLLTFTLGALLPLGFTDGSTLLHYLKK